MRKRGVEKKWLDVGVVGHPNCQKIGKGDETEQRNGREEDVSKLGVIDRSRLCRGAHCRLLVTSQYVTDLENTSSGCNK